jgi:hypothetical protein
MCATVVVVALLCAAVLLSRCLAQMVGAVVLILLMVAAARAEERRAEIPLQYRSAWCATNWGTIYRRCQERDRGVQFTIDRQTVTTEETTCTLSAVRRRGGEHRVWLECRDDNQGDHSEQERWRLGTNRTMSRDPFKNQNCPE